MILPWKNDHSKTDCEQYLQNSIIIFRDSEHRSNVYLHRIMERFNLERFKPALELDIF